MIDYIVGMLTKDIYCRVDPREFHFRRGEESLNVQTYIYVTMGKPTHVMSVGSAFQGSQQCMKIELFERSPNELLQSKGEFLDVLLRYAFSTLSGRRAMVRPRVIFSNTNSLQEYLSGYQQNVLTDSAMKAGAREIIFKE
jgi:hypothetical protein